MTNIILTSPDFGHNTFYIVDAMNEAGHPTIRAKSNELPVVKNNDWVVRWGSLARINNDKTKVINRKSAIRETVNKGVFRNKVANIGHAASTWLDVKSFIQQRYDDVNDTIVPVIVRPLSHQRSENLYFCEKIEDVSEACDELGEGNYYISEYIAKQKEFRVFVANGRAMIMAEKIPADRNAITWGCVEEGVLDYIGWDDWVPEVAQCAIESFNLSTLDFAAVDIMWKDGKAYFLEANTAPEVWRYYGQCFAKVFTYMTTKERGRDRIPIKDYTNWKNYIHPAISNKAVV